MQPPTIARNQQAQDLRDALIDAFDLQSFTQLVYFNLGETLANVVNVNQPFAVVAFQFIVWAERMGATEALIRAMYEVRRNNAHVQAYFRQYPLPVAGAPGELPRSVGRGLVALVNVATSPEGGTVQDVIRRSRPTFNAIHYRIDVLGRYKRLHDTLHTIDFRLFGVLRRSALAFRTNPDEQVSLNDYTGQLEDRVTAANQTAATLDSHQVEDAWIDPLRRAVERLRQALEGMPGNPERLALLLLGGVLAREPSRINGLLMTQAQELQIPLDLLAQALSEICNASVPGQTSLPAAVPEATTALERLRPLLKAMIAEHDFWQSLDNKLRLAADSASESLDDMLFLWPDIVATADVLCELRPDTSWAEGLRLAKERFAAAQAARQALRIRMAFDDFRRVARERFYNLDLELMDLFDNLDYIGTSLGTLLGEIT